MLGQTIGYLMIALLFIGLFYLCVKDIGIEAATFTFLVVSGLFAFIFTAVYLINKR